MSSTLIEAQIYDYGLAIKTANWDDIWTNMLRIYNVLTMLNSPEYEKNVLLQLLQLRWMVKTEHPCMEVIRRHPYLMNGEDVELANSHLSRMTTSCSVRSKITDVERIFILLPNFRNAVRNATGGEPKDREGDMFMSAESYEVQKAAEFLLAWSESVNDDTWLPYRRLTTREKYWGTREEEDERRAWHAKTRRIRLGEAQLKSHMNRNVLKLKAGLAGDKIPPKIKNKRRRVVNAADSSDRLPTHDEKDDVVAAEVDDEEAGASDDEEEVDAKQSEALALGTQHVQDVNTHDPLEVYDHNKETAEELDGKHVGSDPPLASDEAIVGAELMIKRKGKRKYQGFRRRKSDDAEVDDVHSQEMLAASEEGKFACLHVPTCVLHTSCLINCIDL